MASLALIVQLLPIGPLDRETVAYVGLGLAVLAIIGTLGSQAAMGESWRPDVDEGAETPLVMSGPFSLVRNPILTCTATTALGLALIASCR